MPKEKRKRLSEMTEKDWKEWSERFGHRMEVKGKAFGNRMRERFESKEKKLEKDYRFWPNNVLWPLVGSVFGIIVLLILVYIINWLNIGLGSTFVGALSAFILGGLPWLFLGGLLLAYAKRILRVAGWWRWLFAPIVVAIGISFAAWIIGSILLAVNVSAHNAVLSGVAGVLTNSTGLFVLFLVLGYIFVFFGKFIESMVWVD